MKRFKILVLFSGGLDSLLVLKFLKDLKFQVEAIHFINPFCKTDIKYIKRSCNQFNIKLNLVKLDKNYVDLIRNPKHGYGKNLNPCIDCRIHELKLAKAFIEKNKFDYIATGEVLNERPMSQNKKSLELIDEESGLKRKILRPLSGKLLDSHFKDLFLDIQGRQRKKQLAMAKEYKIKEFLTPSGGCLLTDPSFVNKVKDLLKEKDASLKDIELLKYGRYFKKDNCKIIVGRNKEENKKLLGLSKGYKVLEVLDVPSPVTLLKGDCEEFAARLTVRYSDTKEGIVKCGKKLIKAKALENPEGYRL